MKIKAGTILVLETGECSDYTFHGPLRVVKDFDQAKAEAEHRTTWTAPDKWTHEPDTDSFMGWLSSQGYVEPIDGVVSWHIGSYGRLDVVIQPEPEASDA